MTIDNTWLQSFKSEAREAFTPTAPFKAHAVFSDGQIRLMQAPPKEPQTWDTYIYNRFVRYYQPFLENIKTIVIAFDNYEHVPEAKCMTQDSRRKHVPQVNFSETSPLPCMVPEGEYWTQCMANRTFKSKVIELLVMRLPHLILHRHPTKHVIIDYDVPQLFTLLPDGKIDRQEQVGMLPMGEADVKFCRWSDKFQRIIVDSIDGDSVPIALMHHEMLLERGECPPKVAIYRYELLREKPEAPAADKNKKRKAQGPQDDLEEGPVRKAAPKRPHLAWEYMDVHMLYETLKDVVRQTVGSSSLLPSHQGHEIRMLIGLITLTGTDFTRHLPQVSGKTVLDMLPSIWLSLAIAYTPTTGQFNVEHALARLIPKIYSEKFHKHVGVAGRGYAGVYQDIMRSGISKRTKDSLASLERMQTTIKNCNWVLEYWKCQQEGPPHPITTGEYGYVKTPGKNGKTTYEDLLIQES